MPKLALCEMETDTSDCGKRINVELAPLSQADGSARFEVGKTAMLASINGPDQVSVLVNTLCSACFAVLV